jgi:hypothetical protein
LIARLFSHVRGERWLIWLGLFGPIEARGKAGEDVLPRGRKAQAILSYLALTAEEAIPRKDSQDAGRDADREST